MPKSKTAAADLIAAALKTMHNAHAPYSRFKVGCALTTSSGKVFVGCNMENASYGATICAERVAIGAMVAAGEKKIAHMVIVNSSANPVSPCGMCLQVISEFAATPNIAIVSQSRTGKRTLRKRLRDFLPLAFTKSDLN